MYMRALRGFETALGAEHMSTLQSVICLSDLCIDQVRVEEARTLFQQAKQQYSRLNPSLQKDVDKLEQRLSIPIDKSIARGEQRPSTPVDVSAERDMQRLSKPVNNVDSHDEQEPSIPVVKPAKRDQPKWKFWSKRK